MFWQVKRICLETYSNLENRKRDNPGKYVINIGFK